MTILIIFVAALLVWIVWQVPKIQADKAKDKLTTTELPLAEDKFRKTIASSISGLLVLGGFIFTWSQLKTSQENFNKSIDLQERGQVTERITKAVEQLNNQEFTAARIGGIYSLGRIARDSDNVSDQDQVIEILAAFIREQPNSGAGESLTKEISAAMAAIAARRLDSKEVEKWLEQPSPPSIDLQNIDLHGLGLKGNFKKRPNLSRLDLEGTNLLEAKLAYADLLLSDLDSANLECADLSQADLRKTTLQEANMARAKLIGANLEGAVLTGANFENVDLHATKIDRGQLGTVCLNDFTLKHLPHGVHPPESINTLCVQVSDKESQNPGSAPDANRTERDCQ
jgi:uncharacterized protein YjbI with pentapeptide repeats